MRPPLPPGLARLPVAHRALHDRAAGRPENSPPAIAAAVAAGYAIEIDLQLSADGQAMVFHDETLDRLTPHQGPLAARTAAELARIPLRHCEATIPRLVEVLDMIAGRVPLLIEIKDQTGTMGKTDGRLEQATAVALARYRGEVAVMSFNPHSVAAMARLAPLVPRGLTTSAYDPADWAPLAPETCARLREIRDYEGTASSFVSHEARDLTRPRLAELKAAGAQVLCWTIRSPDEEAAARRHACNITFEGYPAPFPA
jgi:glycerophosphoryl diester phosphodiesterase